MQQTSKYQFNLIEGTDDFSPTPLNDNMERVEEELSELNDTVAQHTAAIGTGGHNCRIAWGSYVGTGAFGTDSPNSLSFDFTPAVILIRTPGVRYTTVLVRGCTTSHGCINDSYEIQVSWTDAGVSWYSPDASNTQNNSSGSTYYYTAMGYN